VGLDDLGLPKCSDPGSLALAYQAIVRGRHDLDIGHSGGDAGFVDELGLPEDGCPSDFAKAFGAVRSRT